MVNELVLFSPTLIEPLLINVPELLRLSRFIVPPAEFVQVPALLALPLLCVMEMVPVFVTVPPLLLLYVAQHAEAVPALFQVPELENVPLPPSVPPAAVVKVPELLNVPESLFKAPPEGTEMLPPTLLVSTEAMALLSVLAHGVLAFILYQRAVGDLT